jgi:replicative DNA helicase
MICTTAPNQRAVLSGILATNKRDQAAAIRRMSYISLMLRPYHFTSPYNLIFKAALVYLKTVQAIVKYEHFVDIAKRQSLEEFEFNSVVQTFVELENLPIIEESEFRYQVHKLKEQTKSDKLADTFVDGMEILQSGKKIGNKLFYGYDAAMSLTNQRLGDLSRDDDSGDVSVTNKDIGRVLNEYSDRKFGRLPVYMTGFEQIDKATAGGFQPGDLVFIPGYTSEGKSTLVNTLFDRWVFQDKLNVVFGTAESSTKVLQRRLVSIRSADPKYGGPVAYQKLKEGKLGDSEKQLEMVLRDMARTDIYGNYVLFPIKNGSTVSSVFDTVEMYNEIFPVHLFIWDYIGYTSSEVKRNTEREEMSTVVRAAKIKTLNFDSGRGIVTVSPYAVPRGRWEKAVTTGAYTLACMEETSAAEKAADIVQSVLLLPTGKTVSQTLKNRDGPKYLDPFEIDYDQTCARFVPRAASVSL